MTMAELLAKQDNQIRKSVRVSRGQEVEGVVVAIFSEEVILDLGAKSEGVLPKKELSEEQQSPLKIGDKLTAFVIYPENESGQVVLGLQKISPRSNMNNTRFAKFDQAQRADQVLIGKGIEVNKGGLVVEVGGVRGFIPTSQLALAFIGNPEDLIDKEVKIKVIEIDVSQNRLIFTQVVDLTEEVKAKIKASKVGDVVEGKIYSILAFGLVLKLDNDLDGLIHISEVFWEKVEDLKTHFKEGEVLKAKIVSIDEATGRINLSLKQLAEDPFAKLSEKFQADDIIKVEVTKITPNGVMVSLEGEIEGFIPAAKLESESGYDVGAKISCIVDSIDSQRRRVNLVPFITSTKDLIYK